jgi:hypothetical protein
MVKSEITVKKTTEYGKFKAVKGNREVKRGHVLKLKLSVKEKNLLKYSPILVNENFEVIDGQHRLEVCREYKLPVYYVVVKNSDIYDVQMLNSSSKSWALNDYMTCYCELGKDDYCIYMKFKKENKLSHGITQLLLSGNRGEGGGIHKDFKAGNFKIVNLMKANKQVKMLKDIEAILKTSRKKFYMKRSFATALLMLFDEQDYNHERMLRKVAYLGDNIGDYENYKSYLRIFQEIYNDREKKKVIFPTVAVLED